MGFPDGMWLALAIGLLALVWRANTRAREQALAACRAACRRADVQLLDQTVALDGIRPVRLADGRMGLRRRYAFEVSGDGVERWPGELVVRGGRVERIVIHHPDGTTVL